jgi:type IV secretory pathway VirB2 component (pilin)
MKMDLKIAKQYTLAFCLMGVIILLSNNAWAETGDSNSIVDVLCNVIKQLQGGIGKAVATIAIIVLGIGLFLGKLNWTLALATAIGVGIIFGAGTIVSWLSPAGAGGCGV